MVDDRSGANGRPVFDRDMRGEARPVADLDLWSNDTIRANHDALSQLRTTCDDSRWMHFGGRMGIGGWNIRKA